MGPTWLQRTSSTKFRQCTLRGAPIGTISNVWAHNQRSNVTHARESPQGLRAKIMPLNNPPLAYVLRFLGYVLRASRRGHLRNLKSGSCIAPSRLGTEQDSATRPRRHPPPSGLHSACGDETRGLATVYPLEFSARGIAATNDSSGKQIKAAAYTWPPIHRQRG